MAVKITRFCGGFIRRMSGKGGGERGCKVNKLLQPSRVPVPVRTRNSIGMVL